MRRSLSAIALTWCLASGVLLFQTMAAAGELESLIDEYNAAKPKARDTGKGGKGWGGGPGGGGGWGKNAGGGRDWRRPESPLKPILMKIASLGTPQALAFVQNEYLKERPDVAVACVEPLLTFAGDKVLDVLFSNFTKRDHTVKQEVLYRLGASNRDLKSLEGTLAGLLHSEQQADVRRELPSLLAKIGTVSAAKELLGSVRAPSGKDAQRSSSSSSKDPGKAPPQRPQGGGGGPGGGFGRPGGGFGGPGGWGPELTWEQRIVQALKATNSDEVKGYLSGDAYTGSPPPRLEVLADLAGEMKLEAARPRLEGLLDSAEDGVALRSLAAIVKLGAGPSEARIAESLKKGKHSVAFRIQALDCLAASATPAALAGVLAAAQDPNPETRAVAVGSLAQIPGSNEEAARSVVAALKDPDVLVRGAAVRALRKIRYKPMVPGLIELLAAEKEERLKVNALELLLTVTGKNMGLVWEDWRKWWQVAEPTFEFPSTEVARSPTESRAHDLKYFGVEVSSKRLAFLLDASLSMDQEMTVYLGSSEKKAEDGKTRARDDAEKKSGPTTKAKKIDVLKREMTRVVNGLSNDTQVNIITFAQNPRPWQDTLQPVTGGGREKVLGFVRGITMGFGTNIFDSLEVALRDKRVDMVFLLTDGQPTHGKFVDPPSILREVQTLNRLRGVVINCIAFGEESPFLKDLAAQNDGVYRFVNSY